MSDHKNVIIKSAEICIEAHGLLTLWLLLDFGDSTSQGFGGWCLYNSNFPDKDRAGRFIQRVLEIADVRSWEELPGKTIRVRASLTRVHAIGHILKDDWFTPSTDLVAP